MSSLSQAAKRRLPPRVWGFLRGGYLATRDMATIANPRFWANAGRIQTYKDRHKGERCFIIGNGPSLKRTDLSLLESEYTFGLNRIYLAFDRLGFSTTYYVSVNDLVIRQCAEEIRRLSCPKFSSWVNRGRLGNRSDMMYLRRVPGPSFSTDIAYGVWEGATVTYVAMQVAYYMGFGRVILVGVDHHFETKGSPHQEIVSEGNDTNHFDNNYFGKGFRWNLPDLATSELAYCIARLQFESDNREIIDATVGGKLTVFRKIEFTSLFSRSGL